MAALSDTVCLKAIKALSEYTAQPVCFALNRFCDGGGVAGWPPDLSVVTCPGWLCHAYMLRVRLV